MHIDYTGRSTTVTPKLRQQAESELIRIEKVAGHVVSVHVVLTEDKYRQIAEITMNTGEEILVSTCEGTEMTAALHDCLRRIEQQIVRHNQKKTTQTRHPRNMAQPTADRSISGLQTT